MKPDRADQPSWHAAVVLAGFDPYEPDTDGYRWAGGFSADGTSIGICGRVGQHTVSVETTAPERTMPDNLERRAWINDLLFHHLMAEGDDAELPYELKVASDDRHVDIGPESKTCQGMRVVGGTRWIGGLTVDGLRLKITTSSPEQNLAVRKCTDTQSLTRTPPPRD